MVERFHRQLKAAIMAHESPSLWTITLQAVGPITRHSVCRKRPFGQIGYRDDLRHDTQAARLIYRPLYSRCTYRLRQLLRQVTGSHVASIYLFIQTYFYRVKTLLAFGYFAYVPCFMTSICIKSEDTYLNNNYHIMYNSYNN